MAERRRQAARELEKRRKSGQPVSPVTILGRKIATTFWGKAWCDNLEAYADFSSRIGRGRTYVRNGSVVDLQIAPGAVTAVVSGSSLYDVKIEISEVARPHWSGICRDCAGGIDSLVELLQGRFSTGVMQRLCRQADGLFPKPAEVRFECSCPDWAYMCKHVAAVLYGVGARLDQQPELLFRLRSVDASDLVAHIDTTTPISKSGTGADKVLAEDDLSALFGLDMDDADAGEARPGAVSPVARSGPGRKKRPSANAPARAASKQRVPVKGVARAASKKQPTTKTPVIVAGKAKSPPKAPVRAAGAKKSPTTASAKVRKAAPNKAAAKTGGAGTPSAKAAVKRGSPQVTAARASAAPGARRSDSKATVKVGGRVATSKRMTRRAKP